MFDNFFILETQVDILKQQIRRLEKQNQELNRQNKQLNEEIKKYKTSKKNKLDDTNEFIFFENLL